jgi:hypothetical protein
MMNEIFFIEYEYGDFINIQGWVPTTIVNTNMFTHGNLRMWHMAKLGFFEIFCQTIFFFNHLIETTRLCYVAT